MKLSVGQRGDLWLQAVGPQENNQKRARKGFRTQRINQIFFSGLESPDKYRRGLWIHQSQKFWFISPKKNFEPELSVPGQETRYVILHLQLRRRAQEHANWGGRKEERWIQLCNKASRNPPKRGRGRGRCTQLWTPHPGTHLGGKEKEREKEEKKRRRREDKRRSQLCTSHPGTRQEGGERGCSRGAWTGSSGDSQLALHSRCKRLRLMSSFVRRLLLPINGCFALWLLRFAVFSMEKLWLCP